MGRESQSTARKRFGNRLKRSGPTTQLSQGKTREGRGTNALGDNDDPEGGYYAIADLDEMSIGRIYHHTTTGTGYAIMSADRSERTPEQNKVHRKALLKHLREQGHGVYPCEGRVYGTDSNGTTERVYEHSTMVHNVDKNQAADLARHAYEHHNQEAVLHVHPKEGPHLVYGETGKREKVGDEMTTHPAGAFFTQYKNRKFGFKDKQPLAASMGMEGIPLYRMESVSLRIQQSGRAAGQHAMAFVGCERMGTEQRWQ